MIKESMHTAVESSILIGVFLKIAVRLKNLRVFIIVKGFIFFLKERLKIICENSILYFLIRPKEGQKDFYSESIAFKISEKTLGHFYKRTKKYPKDSRIMRMGEELIEYFKNITSRNVGIIILTAIFTNTSIKLIYNGSINTFELSLGILIILSGVLLCLSNSPFEDLLKTSCFFRRIQNPTKKQI